MGPKTRGLRSSCPPARRPFCAGSTKVYEQALARRATRMRGVSNEVSNTDKMRQHQLTKTKVVGDAMRHEDIDLMVCTDIVDQTRTTVLNRCSDHATFLEVLDKNPDDKCLVSDVDPQLIMKVFFKEKVNLSSVTLRFGCPPSKGEDD